MLMKCIFDHTNNNITNLLMTKELVSFEIKNEAIFEHVSNVSMIIEGQIKINQKILDPTKC